MSDFSVGVLGVCAVFIIPALYICVLRILNRRAASCARMQHTSDGRVQYMSEKDAKALSWEKSFNPSVGVTSFR